MPDMLVRLYDLPDARRYLQAAAEGGFVLRRAEPWERERLRRFVTREFGELWAVESDGAVVIPGSEVGVYRPLLELVRKGEL